MIIINLFQEDNTVSTRASVTYGPQLQLQILSFVIDKRKLLKTSREYYNKKPQSTHDSKRKRRKTERNAYQINKKCSKRIYEPAHEVMVLIT